MALASLLLAAMICWLGEIRILTHLSTADHSAVGQSSQDAVLKNEQQKHRKRGVDLIVTILFISGGTEGLNALLKFLNYKKEGAKGSAANTQSDAEGKTIKGKDALSVVRST